MERDELGRLVRQTLPLEGVRKVIAERMLYSKHTYPQGTGQVQLQVDNLIKFRKELQEKEGVKVSFGNLYLKAAACAVEENMNLNGQRTGTELIYYDDINLKVSATINGILIEPVLMNADRKDILEINEEMNKIYANLRKGKLMKVNLEGGTFAVTNIGTFLIDIQQPFISPPGGAIMGVARNRRLPMFDENDNVVPANMTNFALTIDHGFVDGAEVDSFFRSLNKVLQDPWTWMFHKRAAAEE